MGPITWEVVRRANTLYPPAAWRGRIIKTNYRKDQIVWDRKTMESLLRRHLMFGGTVLAYRRQR